MSEMTRDTSRKYVGGLVWLPAYVVIFVYTLSSIDKAWLATATLLAALIVGNVVFELLSRILLGDKRLYISTGVIIFIAQIIIFGAMFAWGQ